MKKIAKLSIILLLMMFVLTVNVYAKLNCNINMQSEREDVKQEQEITINVKLSNIESERGIIAIEAILEYDKDCLTLSKMEGQNSWHTPIEGLSYNTSNGKLVIDKEGLAKSDETILKITFKANKTSKKSTTVSLRNIVVADGTAPAKIANVSKNITIKEEGKTDTKPTTGEEEKTDTKPITGEEEKTDTKPTTGEEEKTDTKPITGEEEKTDKKTTTSKNQNTNNTKTTEKTTTNEEQETNTNTDTMFEEKQETNTTTNENENTNTSQTIDDIDNKGSFTAGRKRILIISLSALLVVSIAVGIIIYRKRRGKNKR